MAIWIGRKRVDLKRKKGKRGSQLKKLPEKLNNSAGKRSDFAQKRLLRQQKPIENGFWKRRRGHGKPQQKPKRSASER
jgi:hypothetical protein